MPIRWSVSESARTTRTCVVAIIAVVCELSGCRPTTLGVRSNMDINGATWSRLADAGWDREVGAGLGLWVSIAEQRLRVIHGLRIESEFPCSTAANGPGQRDGSNCTPLGWHRIAERIGDGLPVGAVLKDRRFTGEVWRPADGESREMILTRILWLRGCAPGFNAGSGIDSYERYIYIHGTPAESRLGTPASYGCVRLANRDVIRVFDRAAVGTPVLITSW